MEILLKKKCLYIIFGVLILAKTFSQSSSQYNNNKKSFDLTNSLSKKIERGFLAFEENKGQVSSNELALSSIKFYFKQHNLNLFLNEEGIIYQFAKSIFPEKFEGFSKNKNSSTSTLLNLDKQIQTETFRIDMKLEGANKNAIISTEGKSNNYTNYYTKNVMDVHSFHKIIYHDIYPNIDWAIYTKDDFVKYDFIIRPGGDPSIIKMTFKYQEGLELNEDGSFSLKSSMGTIKEDKPFSFQEQKSISTKFILTGDQISFALGEYDKNKELIIDPSLIWSTYYGGSSSDYGMWTSTDASGNVYLTGFTQSSSNIASGGYQVSYGGNTDAYLTKFDAGGNRLWSTYYGGTGADYGFSCTTDLHGNVYLVGGWTTSTANISSSGHQNTFGGGNNDAFLVKFNANGTRLWATYYGGSGNDYGYTCSTDNVGNVYLTGPTTSTSSIASNGYMNSFGGLEDAYLVKFNSAGIRQWGTYYGSTGDDFGMSCVNDANANIYLSGYSSSTTNIASGGHQNSYGGGLRDAFLTKFDSTGTRLWATYYGGSAYDDGASCATDALNNVYMAGATSSTTNIAVGGHQNSYGNGVDNAYLVKFNSSGIRQWATYYGGAGDDYGNACVIDGSGNVLLVGNASSTSNIASSGYQNTLPGSSSAFLAKFTSGGVRVWGSYFGGANYETGNSCAIDTWGNIYLTGDANSSSAIASGGFQTTYGGATDGYLVKFCNAPPTQSLSVSGSTLICSDVNSTYTASPVPNVTYSWALPAGWIGSSSSSTINLLPISSGTLNVSISNACGSGSIQSFSIQVTQTPTLTISNSNSVICRDESIFISVTGANSYTWNTGSNSSSITVNPIVNTTYSVIGKNGSCSDTKSLTIIVNNCVGLQENIEDNKIMLYPNPTKDLLYINLENYDNVGLSIYNVLGERILDFDLRMDNSLLDMTEFKKGIYFFKFQRDNIIIENLKIIKE